MTNAKRERACEREMKHFTWYWMWTEIRLMTHHSREVKHDKWQTNPSASIRSIYWTPLKYCNYEQHNYNRHCYQRQAFEKMRWNSMNAKYYSETEN